LCKQCGIHLQFEKRNNLFCSHSCSATNSNTGSHKSNKTKEKISNGVIKYLSSIEKPPLFTNIEFCICKYCNKKFVRKQEKGASRTWCSDECENFGRSLFARNNPGLGTKRSKQEIELYNLCKDYFGETVTNNENIFNGWDADILIYDYKIAILWNGPWHYKEMGFSNHSLKQVQNRDNIKIKEIRKKEWIPMIFEDRYYTPESAFKYLVDSITRLLYL
jgi:hypothetical protein